MLRSSSAGRIECLCRNQKQLDAMIVPYPHGCGTRSSAVNGNRKEKSKRKTLIYSLRHFFDCVADTRVGNSFAYIHDAFPEAGLHRHFVQIAGVLQNF